jgi:DNA-directed RNA polymerase delta subunit
MTQATQQQRFEELQELILNEVEQVSDEELDEVTALYADLELDTRYLVLTEEVAA